MARVLDVNGAILAEVDNELLRDFFDEIMIEDKTLLEVLQDYLPEHRKAISEYIIWRLAEVDPGYLPDPFGYHDIT